MIEEIEQKRGRHWVSCGEPHATNGVNVLLRGEFFRILKEYPMVVAVKEQEKLKVALDSPAKIIFLLYGDIMNLKRTVSQIKEKGKIAIVHMDLIEGLDNKEVSVRFIKENTEADGIISIRANIIRAGAEAGLITIQRFFLLDSKALENVLKHMGTGKADAYEILPGVIPKTLKKITAVSKVPIIAGGLIQDREDIMQALDAGATAVSSTDSRVWFLADRESK